MDFVLEFIADWQPDLLLTLIIIVGGLAQIIVPIFVKSVKGKRWAIGGACALVFGLLLLAIRFI